MTTSQHKNARFAYVNWLQPGKFTTTTVNPVNPNNLNSGVRSKTWKAKGTFEITASNRTVYINGSTFLVPIGVYDVTSLISAFNTATSETLSRNPFGRFEIDLGTSGTLNLSSTTNAIWSTLGFLGTSDLTGTVFTADERRYSTGEWVKVDVGFSQIPDFAALIGPANEVFSCSTGVVKLQGNNLDVWSAPSVDLEMETSNHGAFIAPNITTACRYWRILVLDVKNPNVQLSVAHIGFSTVLTNTNIATGFNRVRTDQSSILYSEGGQFYVDRKPRLMTITGTSVQFLKASELVEMEQLFYDLGVGRPFFICIDPSQTVSSSLGQMTHYVQLDSPANLEHVINSYYNLSFSMREVL